MKTISENLSEKRDKRSLAEFIAKSNPSLVCAAPDLLSALRWFADELPGIIRQCCPTGIPMIVAEAHDAARAALNKAEN